MSADTDPLLLYNTLSQAKEPFVPADPARVTLYVCGPTVYNYAHIGNARPAVVFDVLFRLLRRRYGADHVVYARNVTDIDDKIIKAADGGPIGPVVERFTAAYHEDMTALGTLPPTMEPCATHSIAGIVTMIGRLIDGGHAYATEGHVLFHVPSCETYGRLSRRSRAEMIDGARVEVAPYKRDPADFVLWKPSTPAQPGWDSPWGRGRPGWHIECSAMIADHLGPTIDIHGGGQDLKFPHHENELAQSACAHHAPLARVWMHNGFVNLESEKMSKSLGNVLLVRDLLARAPGEAIRYALLSAHYRKPLDWRDEGLAAAREVLDKLYRALGTVPAAALAAEPAEPAPAVVAALADDLNTPLAFAELHALAGTVNSAVDPLEKCRAAAALRASGALLGLLGADPAAWARGGETSIPVAEIERLIAERAAARRNRDFATADGIRDALARHDIVIEDRDGETTWRQAG